MFYSGSLWITTQGSGGRSPNHRGQRG